MERQTGYYVLLTMGLSLCGVVYNTYLKCVMNTTLWYDILIGILMVSLGFLGFLLLFEKFGFPTWRTVREYVKILSVILLLWIIALIIVSIV